MTRVFLSCGEQPVVAARPLVMPVISFDEKKRLGRFQRLHPHHFYGDASKDAQNFLDRCHQTLRNLGLVESNGVEFTIFQSRRAARRWWKTYKLGGRTSSPPFLDSVLLVVS